MKVLIPVDGSRLSLKAVELFKARAAGLENPPELKLITVLRPPPARLEALVGYEGAKRAWDAEGARLLEPAQEKLEGIPHETEIIYGHPGRTIAKAAADSNADLIIMGARGASEVESFFLGSVSRAVLEYSTLPVLIARGEILPEKKNLTVAVAVDASDYGAAAARFIGAHPEMMGPKPLVKVICVTPDRGNAKSDDKLIEKGQERYAEEDEELWHRAADPVLAILQSSGIEAEGVHLTGRPAETIASWAEQNADLLVMGSRGYGRIKSAVLGSTATRAGALTKLPVLLIRIPE
ncbi:universal stress protein [Sutterella sp.]|uniref:universal stress protein n=1 Tax=Sutterella sp. TaxID=1981025 RepID=UPI0026DF3A6E|nr:universal stress protein [Sutterella sp.]MDO5532354.1 universal stress protein [Sutterella sp.]